MPISLFGNYGSSSNQSNSQSTSNSGFSSGNKDMASDFSANRLMRMQDIAQNRLLDNLPSFSFSSTMPGLFKEQEGWANAFASQLFNKTSGSAAARGQLSPFNLPAVVGSALTKAAPTILPMISQNLQTAALLPEQIFAQRHQNAMSPLQALIAGLGSSSQSTGSTFGSSMNVGGGGQLGGGGSGLLGTGK